MKRIASKYLMAFVLLASCTDDKDVQPPVAVVADFTVSQTKIKAGESLTFTDLSTGEIVERHWVFEGGDPNTSNEVSPVVKYASPGTYSVSLHISSNDAEDTEDRQQYITVEAKEIKPRQFRAGKEITFGHNGATDFMQSMIALNDNSFICVGWIDDENGPDPSTNILITKVDQELNLIWEKVIGGSKDELVRTVIPTKDGGFILTASTESNDRDISGNKGSADIAIFKLSGDGNVQWAKTYGGSNYEGVNHNSIIEIENGYAFIGFSNSADGDVPDNVAKNDIWLAEVDIDGTITNSFTLGSAENDTPYTIVKSNSGYVVLSKIGATTNDFDKEGIWVFEISGNGNLLWKTFIDAFNAGKLIKTEDNGYLTLSTNRNNVTDLFLTKFDAQGAAQWTNTYALPGQEFAQDIVQVGNEYILLATSERYGNQAGYDSAFVAKVSAVGALTQWEMFGNSDVATAEILKIGEGKYLLGGSKDVSDSFIDFEFWLQVVEDSD